MPRKPVTNISNRARRNRPNEHNKRVLSPQEQAIRNWIRANHGILTRIAKECDVSVAFVNRIAYNRADTQSQGLRVESRLQAHNCPLIQTV